MKKIKPDMKYNIYILEVLTAVGALAVESTDGYKIFYSIDKKPIKRMLSYIMQRFNID